MRFLSHGASALVLFALIVPAACGGSGGRRLPDGSGGSGGAGSASSGGSDFGNTGGTGSGSGGGGGDGLVVVPPSANCGDGVLDDDEACDDGNTAAADGCAANCRAVEAGFVCAGEGTACTPYAKCGDSKLIAPEQCDDGNIDSGDGCSPTCKFEIGFTCDGIPSECRETSCGDGILEGAETCEGSDGMPFDGCALNCQSEPACSSNGCTSKCGDGLVIGAEKCDDGNAQGGDGCSASCQVEAGYVCSQAPPCEGSDCTMDLPIVFRDFSSTHPDFGVSCSAQELGIPEAVLSAEGKPILANATGACIDSASSFAEWYTKAASNTEVVGSIRLYADGNGGYVNRFGATGEGWRQITQESQTSSQRCLAAGCCTDLGLQNEPWNCCEANDTTCQPCSYNSSAGCAQTIEYLDGNPLFFPVDDIVASPADPAGTVAAKIPEEVYKGGWKWEDGSSDGSTSPPHNFHFTSEIAYWFRYDEGMTANLNFVGDDDVWVFINRRLAVDLGGLHVPVEGAFTIQPSGAIEIRHGVDEDTSGKSVTEVGDVSDFGLEPGGVYEVRVFHAERKVNGSSYKLTLSGFNASRSECSAVCGDGIVAGGEQCDGGTDSNTGGHNRCNADCTLGAFCGDGIVQAEDGEACDDGDPNRPSNCAGCRIIMIK